MTVNERKGDFWGKFTRGDFGLAKTFWLLGFLPNAIVHIINLQLLRNNRDVIVLVLAGASLFYVVLLWTGVWRAANRYKGRSDWSVLARTWVVLTVMAWPFTVLLYLM